MDAGRGFGILGILWLNIFIFALPYEAMVVPAIWGDHTTANVAVWNFVAIFISGVMRGMISMLFGAAALMMMQRAEAAAGDLSELDKYFRRLLLLIVFGVVHSYVLLWPHDILYVYGVIGLLIFPFRNLSVKRLAILGSIMLAASVFFTAHNSSEIQDAQSAVENNLTDEELEKLRQQEPMVDEFDDSSLQFRSPAAPHAADFIQLASLVAPSPTANPTEAEIEKQFYEMVQRIGAEIEERQKGYIANFFSMAALTFDEQTDEMLTNHLLDIATFFIFGMIMLKTGFFTLGLDTKTYVKIAVIGYLLGLSFGAIGTLDFEEGEFLEPLSSAVSEYTYDLRRFFLAVANFAALALAIQFNVLKWLTDSLAYCGRMALSLYVSQTIICNTIFLGFGYYGQLEHDEIAKIAIAITLAQLLAARVYFKFYKQGPLEWLLRCLIGNPRRVLGDDRRLKA